VPLNNRQQSLRDALASRLSRLGTFAASVLVLLVLLLVFVEQQIREYNREIREAVIARIHAGRKLAASRQALNALRHEFFTRVSRTSRLSEKSKQQDRTIQAADNELYRLEGEVEQLLTARRSRLRRLAGDREVVLVTAEDSEPVPPPREVDTPPPPKELLYEKVLSPRFLNDGGGWEQKLAMFTKAEEQLRAEAEAAERSFGPNAPSYDAASRVQALKILQTYEDKVRAGPRYRTNIEAAGERIRKAEATKQSIPTPLGSFEIDPRFALVGMAFAALAAYIFFNLSARRALVLARQFAESLPRPERQEHALPIPSWFFSNVEPVREVAIQPPTVATAAVFHAAWLGLALVLCCEVKRHDASHVLRVGAHTIEVLLGVVGVVAFALCIDFLVPRAAALREEGLSRLMRTRLDRRQVIAAGVIAMAAVQLGVLLRRRRQRKGSPMPDAVFAAEVRVPIYLHLRPQNKDWKWNLTAHARRGVAHHIEVCSRHLPKTSHRIHPRDEAVVHRGWEAVVLYQAVLEIEQLNTFTYRGFRDHAYAVRIREMSERVMELQTRSAPRDRSKGRELAAQVHAEAGKFRKTLWSWFKQSSLAPLNRRRTEKTIQMLLRAIELQPWSYHLHHKLIRIYGRECRFKEIRALIERSRKLAAEALKKTPQAKNILKAKKEFDSWPAKLERRRVNHERKKIERGAQERLQKDVDMFG
jgi:hypothetical protein